MNKNYLLLLVIIFLVGCDPSESKQAADYFYQMRKEKKYNNLEENISKSVINYELKDHFIGKIKALDQKMGKINMYKCTGYKVYTEAGITTAKYRYKVIYEKGITLDSLFLQKQGDKFKIYYYYWQKN